MNLFATDQLWRLALAVIPLAIVVAAVCRWLPCRPSTRHALWLTTILFLIIAPVLPAAPVPDLASLIRPAATADPVSIQPSPSRGALSTVPMSAAQAPAPTGVGTQQAQRSGEIRPAPDRAPSSVDIGRPWRSDRVATGAKATGTAEGGSRARAHYDPFLRELIGPPTQLAAVDAPPAVTSSRSTEVARGGGSNEGLENRIAAPSSRSIASDHRRPGDRRASITSSEPSEERAWAQWLLHMRAIRDEVMSLPPIPAAVWAAGAALLVLAMGWRAARFRLLLRRGTMASPNTLQQVGEASATLGLRRPPLTIMVNQRISPMVWCGRPARLLLPAELWDQLDETGRRAVLYHELAHLKRHDHWVCWLAMAVGCLYWWHPVVWWVRRRLQDEADLCCDAWVTMLMPTARRAYATALLETRRFTSATHPAAPTVGLGASTIRTRRFARRLTMVMSQRITPKLTLGGAVLACALAAGSWLATPTLACPPKKDPPKACESAKAAKAPKAPKIPKAVHVKMPALPAMQHEAGSTFEKHMKLQQSGDREGMSLEERIELLEKQIEIFMKQLEHWGGAMQFEMLELPDMPDMPELPEIPELSQISEHMVMPPDVQVVLKSVPETYTKAIEKATTVYQSALGSNGDEEKGYVVAAPQKLEIRTYELPKGKLDALTKLMVREDVPVLVSPGEDKIQVHGTLDQHMIFEAFCAMIRGEEGEKTFKLPEGKLEALVELMAREDVPVLISPGEGAITVHGNELQQLVFQAFVNMVNPGEKAKAPVGGIYRIEAGTGVPAKIHTGEGTGPIGVVISPEKKAMKDLALGYELKAQAQVGELERLHAVMAGLEKQHREQERLYEKIMRRAEEIEEEVRRVEEQAEDVEADSEELEGEALLAAMQKINTLMLKARQMENEARLLEAQAEAAEARAEAIEAEAEKIEQRVEELEEKIDELEEKMHEQKRGG